jgi:serine/threonine protein phosphatase PrpC
MKPGEEIEADELLPTWDVPEAAAPPVAVPVPEDEVTGQPPLALPVAVPVNEEAPTAAPAPPVRPPAPPEPSAPPATILCPVCGSPRSGGQVSCSDCGYYFSPADLAGQSVEATASEPAVRLQDRFEVRERIGERHGVVRYRGLDHSDGSRPPAPVIILREELPQAATSAAGMSGDRIDSPTGSGEEPSAPITELLPPRPDWPSVGWERGLLRALEQPAMPRVVASFAEGNYAYLVEQVPAGRPLWDAWDDPEATAEQRFGWLIQIAEALHSLHHCNALMETLRPDVVVVSPEGQVRFTDVSDLLPLPLPADAPVRGTLYTAPEILAGTGRVDARADLYSFGAMLYALHVGRELTETDFERPGHPKPFIPQFPDIHPAFGRLMAKTFRREVEGRFPTDEAGREDASGFLELIRALGALRRTLDTVRLEIAAWTTTGMVRSGNEDAFALLHACEVRQDDLSERALVLLADGMGGYEAGEVAAALAVQVLRQNLLSQKPFAALAGASAFPTDPLQAVPGEEGHAPTPFDPEVCKQLIKAALKDANKQVFAASRAPGSKRRGMGCTAEVVCVDGRHVVVGHVGDSRTYHLHDGRLIQLTRDQTLVNRLVELGTLTPEEAETHPRRNELQQAVGGQPDVEPGLYHGVLHPGDWVVVCSDGLTNHVTATDLKEMLLSEATSAEMAARRLINLTNIEGATDNATVVVIRAT